MSQERLENLFSKCDRRGTGFIDSQAFRELCASFEIEGEDADSIFYDLDHDGDNKISFEDFSHGFRDFLTPGARRGSLQLGLSPLEPSKSFPSARPTLPPTPEVEHKTFRNVSENRYEIVQEELPSFGRKNTYTKRSTYSQSRNVDHNSGNIALVDAEMKQKEMEVKHKAAEGAWKQLTRQISKDDVKKVLEGSGDKLAYLYEELQTNEASQHLIPHFEEVMSALITDVKKIDESKRKMEEKIKKERENHTAHLKNLETELDAQVSRIAKQEREKAKLETDMEKRELEEKLQAELDEMKAQLKLFQKVDSWINKEKDEQHTIEAQKRLDHAFNENRHLKRNLGDTQTNIALLKAELGQMRNQYDTKCNELNSEREQRMEYLYEVDNLSRQLELLRDANEKLQDNNDGLREIVDVNSIRSPRASMGKRSPIFNTDDLDTVEIAADILNRQTRKRRNPRLRYTTGSRTPSAYDSDSLRSRESKLRPEVDMQFGLKRFIDDLDSGTSTLPGDENGYDIQFQSELDEETTNAMRILDSVVFTEEHQYEDDTDSLQVKPTPRVRKNVPPPVAPRRRTTVAYEKDRSMTEVSDGEAVEENFEKFGIEVNDHASSRVSDHNSEGPNSITLNLRRNLSFNGKEIAVVPQGDIAGRYSSETQNGKSNGEKACEVKEDSSNSKPVPAPRVSSLVRRPSSAGIKFKKPVLTTYDLEPTGPPDRTYKVVFAGDAAVGKTSFINRITKGYFMENLSSTLGVDFQVKTFRVDERNIAIQLWDTAGQERFRSVTKSYFRRADGVMLLYDVTSEQSFVAVREWIEAVDDVAEKRVPIMLCGNKVDLRQEAVSRNQRVISAEKGERLARNHQAIFLETSSKDGSNVIEALVQLSRDMCSAEDTELQTSALKLRGDDQQINKKSTCCSKSS